MSCACPPCGPVQPCAIENYGQAFPSLVAPMGPPGGPGTFVKNFDALRALNATVFTQGYIAYVAGYAEANDGGGGNFVYDATSATADNNGTILSPTNGIGRWFRLFSGPVDPSWFGAIGDGASHPLSGYFGTLASAQVRFPSATSLTNELDWASMQNTVNGGFRNVVASIGSYVFGTKILDFSNLLALDLPAVFDFGNSTLTSASATNALYSFQQKNVLIQNFRLVGPGSGVAGTVGIFFDSLQPDNTDNCSFKHFVIDGFQTGLKLGSTAADQNAVVDTLIENFLITNCVNAFWTASTNVDNLAFFVGKITACTTGFNFVRAGFLSIKHVTGYGCTDFIKITGPFEAMLIEESQAEVGTNWINVSNWGTAISPISVKSCVVNMDIVLSGSANVSILTFEGCTITGNLTATCTDLRLILQDTYVDAASTFTMSGSGCTLTERNGNFAGTRTLTADGVYWTKRSPLHPGPESYFNTVGATGNLQADAGKYSTIVRNMTGNVTEFSPKNPQDGQILRYIFKQDATGARTLTFDATWVVNINFTPLTTANKVNSLTVMYAGGAWYQIASAIAI